MTYRRETKPIPSQPDKGFTEKLAAQEEKRYLRYRPDFTGAAANYTEVGGWRLAMDKDLRTLY